MRSAGTEVLLIRAETSEPNKQQQHTYALPRILVGHNPTRGPSAYPDDRVGHGCPGLGTTVPLAGGPRVTSQPHRALSQLCTRCAAALPLGHGFLVTTDTVCLPSSAGVWARVVSPDPGRLCPGCPGGHLVRGTVSAVSGRRGRRQEVTRGAKETSHGSVRRTHTGGRWCKDGGFVRLFGDTWKWTSCHSVPSHSSPRELVLENLFRPPGGLCGSSICLQLSS